MNAQEKAQLEENGWKVGTPAQFLGMTTAQEAVVEIKGALSELLIEAREWRGWTQKDLAQRLKTQQAGIARLESGVGAVSLDMMVRALVTAGVSMKEIAEAIGEIELSVAEPQTADVKAVEPQKVETSSTRIVAPKTKSQTRPRATMRPKSRKSAAVA